MTSKALGQFVSGLTNPKGVLGDFQHAARTFVDDSFRLAPKQKYLFHVHFSISENALKSNSFTRLHHSEVDILVKKADLPKFAIQTEKLNQYNRRKVTQTKIDYTPVNITFHDDNSNIIRTLWQSYYNYYYKDGTTAANSAAYQRSAMRGGSFSQFRYGRDADDSAPFFNSITIYQLSRKQWTSATLINPIINSWSHDTVDYSTDGGVENTMTLDYEAVTYDSGNTIYNPPAGFAINHYDNMPSPITLAGGGPTNLLGQQGVLNGAAAVFGALTNPSTYTNPAALTLTAITAINTYQNSKKLTKAGVETEILNAGTRLAVAASTNSRFSAGTPGTPGATPQFGTASEILNAASRFAVSNTGISSLGRTGGLHDASFPVADNRNISTIAILRNLTGL